MKKRPAKAEYQFETPKKDEKAQKTKNDEKPKKAQKAKKPEKDEPPMVGGLKMTEKRIGSRAYHGAEAVALKNGKTPKEARALGVIASDKARKDAGFLCSDSD